MPLTFLNPLFLIALSALAVPLILHFMRRRRRVHQKISTIRFIKLARQRSASRMRIRNLLLWLLRTLLLTAIIMAFALPVVRLQGTGNLLGSAWRDVALVVDNSYSMQYRLGNDTVWSRTQEAALDIINGLNPHDRISIYVAGDHPIPLIEEPISNHEAAKQAITQLQPNARGSALPETLAAACKKLKAAGNREREVFILTDGQALAWENFEKGGADPDSSSQGPGVWDPALASPDFTVFTLFSGSGNPRNAYIKEASISPPLIMADTAARAEVTVAQMGVPQTNTVSLFINGEQTSRRSLDINNDTATIGFPIPPMAPGRHTAKLQLAPDALEIDDTFHLTFNVHGRLPTLSIGTEADTFYVRQALSPAGGKSAIAVNHIAPQAVDSETLSEYKAVFLCNAMPLTGRAILALEEYVRQGGVLAIFPGDSGNREDYAKLECIKTIFQSKKSVEQEDNVYPVRLTQPDDPLLKDFALPPGAAPRMAVNTMLAWEKEALENGEVLLSAGRNQPLLVADNYGDGRVFLFGVSADRSWSTFPITSIFLPVLHRIVRYGANLAESPDHLQPNETLLLEQILTGFSEHDQLFAPTSEPVQTRAVRHDNREVMVAEDVFEQGIYQSRDPGDSEKRTAFAVNVERTESDLTPLNPVKISELTGLEAINVATTDEQLYELVQEHRRGRPLQELFLWLALLFAVAEIVVANRLNRPIASLTSRMSVNTAGSIQPSQHTS